MEKMTPRQRRRAEEILHYHEDRAAAESSLNPGAEQTLAELRAAGIPIGILTRNQRDNALAIARLHGLEFDAVIGREDGPAKPDAFGVLELCRQFAVEPCRAVLVGDYLFDLLSARAAGAVAVLLINNERAREYAEHADYCIENIGEILEIVANHKGG
jgi:HAD superfamily hydrolase (TIGR01509 family)